VSKPKLLSSFGGGPAVWGGCVVTRPQGGTTRAMRGALRHLRGAKQRRVQSSSPPAAQSTAALLEALWAPDAASRSPRAALCNLGPRAAPDHPPSFPRWLAPGLVTGNLPSPNLIHPRAKSRCRWTLARPSRRTAPPPQHTSGPGLGGGGGRRAEGPQACGDHPKHRRATQVCWGCKRARSVPGQAPQQAAALNARLPCHRFGLANALCRAAWTFQIMATRQEAHATDG
jgi:hypothetical protein